MIIKFIILSLKSLANFQTFLLSSSTKGLFLYMRKLSTCYLKCLLYLLSGSEERDIRVPPGLTQGHEQKEDTRHELL